MPRFSIIVTVHGVAGRLPTALDSVLAQSFTDFELLPACADPDSPAGALAGEYAGRDSRVVRVTGGRDAGLRAATGTYVLFLEAADVLVPQSLAVIDGWLREHGEEAGGDAVDVLRLGHERVPWWEGEPVAGPPQDADPADVRLPVWATLHRRAFLREHGALLPAGRGTDLAWSGLVALAAGHGAVLPTLCVRRHERRPGGGAAAGPKAAGPKAAGPKAALRGTAVTGPAVTGAELLDQVELVLDRAAAQRLAGDRARALFTQLFAEVLEHALTAPCDRAFLRRAGRLHRRHRPAGLPTRGLADRLLRRGAATALRVLRPLGRQSARVRAYAARAVLRRRRALLYGWYLRRPLDENLAVFAAYWGRGYACNPAAIHRKARELAPHVRSVFLVKEKELAHMPEDVESVVIGSRRYWEVMARAKYTFNNVNFEHAVRKRPGTVHVQTHHGTPLKRMGVDQIEYRAVAAATGSFGRLMRRVDRWDFSLSSNPHSTEVWSGAYPGAFAHLEYGYPRNDRFYSAAPGEVAAIRARLGVPEDRVALLYAPTYRDYPRDVSAQFDLARFCERLGPEFVVLLRAHYFLDGDAGLRQAVADGRLIDVTSLRDTEDVCLASDALITDYSSIMFDYANLDRPIVTYADDWDVYRDTRGVYFDLLAEPPGHVARTQDELVRVLTSGAWCDEESAALRSRFRARFCAFDDGQAAERVVRRVLLGQGEEELPPVIPLRERLPVPATAAARPRTPAH
ncbi:bifunctional glycosyltransferase/CDP-glycerol:glycerophosphate glycerophosphotransferase [Streptomyces apricus]|uniref:Bifunctional glycosyltransferase family 2 protein/CDP-glycerol:glycerophosphate glycerophosphotransferase n=1 Tax=Streptomyces apricus TaxID=1828112 RepID=A0A5A9ZWV4_9ACTN|nr:bifunctional glycosyltransferase family 2 protein/CDP-glycerol:glycerophosphate glycerophosphotransferase [Streptomyces apricus]KAA0921998.1 bifunctional glycosyltransferase family 2 protein/CDP-glycerol:glycerophosphate glycerophosphotransferase [Streptomyces apricus]